MRARQSDPALLEGADVSTLAGFLELADRVTALPSALSIIHGELHWQTVASTAVAIADAAGGDPLVGLLFGLLHDCMRENDHDDGGLHARAAADLVSGARLGLDDARHARLVEAIRFHAAGDTTADPTVGACWDADRLDLRRVGIVPQAAYLSTSAARDGTVAVALRGWSESYSIVAGRPAASGGPTRA